MIDIFGRDITENGDGTYTCGGITVAQPTASQAIATFNGMAPADWIDPDAPPRES
jgi:hypothetical protein